MYSQQIWQMYDVSNNKYVVAGDVYDGSVYHQDANDRANSYWMADYTDTAKTSFYIRDLRHGKAIVAGDTYDGKLYHQDPKGRQNAIWTKVPVPNQRNVFYLQDLKHHKCIVAGNTYDGNLYHQDANGRQNAMWNLLTVTANVRSGPFFGQARLPLRDASNQTKTIKYFINNNPAKTELGADKISELVALAFNKWAQALQLYNVSLWVQKQDSSAGADVQFEWGTVPPLDGVDYRAAITISTQSDPKFQWGNSTSAPVKVTYSQDLNWRDLSSVVIPGPQTSALFTLFEYALNKVIAVAQKDTDFLSATCHEIGHVLGLEHSTIPDSIIRSTATAWGTYFISTQQNIPDGDIQRVRMRYLDYA
jgi:hypothetical protein